MPRSELQCPLCGTKSTTYTTPGNLCVRCPHCGWYALSFQAHQRFFMGHGSPVLTEEQERRLSAYVKSAAAAKPDAPVELSQEVIQEVLRIRENR